MLKKNVKNSKYIDMDILRKHSLKRENDDAIKHINYFT